MLFVNFQILFLGIIVEDYIFVESSRNHEHVCDGWESYAGGGWLVNVQELCHWNVVRLGNSIPDDDWAAVERGSQKWRLDGADFQIPKRLNEDNWMSSHSAEGTGIIVNLP